MYKEFLKSGAKFITSKGELTVGQLLQLPATQVNLNFLDALAVRLDEEYDKSKGKSFIVKRTSKDKSIKLQLDIVKDILNDMVEVVESAKIASSNKEKLQELLAIKAERQKEETRSMSNEELEKQIKALQ